MSTKSITTISFLKLTQLNNKINMLLSILLFITIIFSTSSAFFSITNAEDIQIYNNDHKNRIIIESNSDFGNSTNLFFGESLNHALTWDNINNYFVFTDNVNFSGNEIINARLENLSSAPVCDNTSSGRIYHNTSDTFSYICNATNWEKIDEETTGTGGKLQPYFYNISPDTIPINTTENLIVTGGNFDEDTVFNIGSGVTVNSITINSDKQATINVTSGNTEYNNISVDAQNDTLDDFGETLTFDVKENVWKLFAITDSSHCAESLAYGTNTLTESSNAYFSTADQDIEHSQFKQILQVDGVTKYEILYDFGNSKTLKNRFNNASINGESVNWTVSYDGSDYDYGPHLWYYSDGANLSSKWDGASGTSKFSDDDGSWGANNGNVDGNGGPYEKWGHGNHNSGDSSCGTYYTNGSSTTSSSIKSFMYYQ